MVLDNYTDKELKDELTKRQKKDPDWLRDSKGYKVFNYITSFMLALEVLILSPIWLPFWMTDKILTWDRGQRKKRAEKEGLDWYKYHSD